LHAAILRSPHAHADIVSIDTSAAEAQPGVTAVLTGEDIKAHTDPYIVILGRVPRVAIWMAARMMRRPPVKITDQLSATAVFSGARMLFNTQTANGFRE